MDEPDRGERVAGTAVLRVQVVAAVAFLGAVAFAVQAFQTPEHGTAAGLMMIAAALAYGLLANAVLRR